MNTSINNKRVAKNTIVLYIRMIFLMLISLYTSRVVLQVLGVEDFGIYNIVGGVIILFSFLNNAMTASIQRFLNIELGCKNIPQAQSYFSASLILHICLGLVILFLGETIGLWFFDNYIQIPETRFSAALWVFHLTLIGTFFNILRTPYNAVIIAEERMGVFAALSVAEAFLKLIIVYLLSLCTYDKLIIYSALITLIIVLIGFLYFFCTRKAICAQFHVCTNVNLYKSLLSFSSWSLLGSVANVGASQGINIFLNIFGGVTVNAAMGISNQVQGAVTSFLVSFQTAINPQIVKLYAEGVKSDFDALLLKASKYSFFLMFIIALPIYLCCKELLSLWLVEVPAYTEEFCKLIIIYSLLDSVQGPLWTSVQATGNIKKYQLLVSLIILVNLPIAYVILFLGFSPISVMWVKVVLNLILLFFRSYYLYKQILFPIRAFFIKVICPSLLIMFIAYGTVSCISILFDGFVKVMTVFILSLFVSIPLFYYIGLDLSERKTVNDFLKAKLN